jgi:hypothetical protein
VRESRLGEEEKAASIASSRGIAAPFFEKTKPVAQGSRKGVGREQIFGRRSLQPSTGAPFCGGCAYRRQRALVNSLGNLPFKNGGPGLLVVPGWVRRGLVVPAAKVRGEAEAGTTKGNGQGNKARRGPARNRPNAPQQSCKKLRRSSYRSTHSAQTCRDLCV